jgi:DNA polymerase
MKKTKKKKKSKKRKIRLKKIHDLYPEVVSCSLCKLHAHRTQVVFGQGNICSKIVFVGEAPGEMEDFKGQGFIGKAGQYLRKRLEEAGIDPDKVFFLNVVKCRPPKNRDPNPTELKKCLPWLHKQLEIIKPNIIVTLGRVATQALLNTKIGIMKLRGKMKIRGTMRIFPMPHPRWAMGNNVKSVRQDYCEELATALKLSKEKPDGKKISWWTHLKRQYEE